MKKILKNYRETLLLLVSILLGTLLGILFGEKILVLKPFGDIFINLLFVIIVPLVFFTITDAIIQMKSPKRLGKIIVRITITFLIMAFIAAFIGIIVTHFIPLVEIQNNANILELMDDSVNVSSDLSLLKRTANLLTVSDFSLLFSKENIIALLVFSILFGLAIRKSKEKENVIKIIHSLNEVVLNMVNLIMYYAPIGLGCYFATLIGTYGKTIALGFLKTFLIYTGTALFIYFVVYSLYAFLSGGKKGFITYWKHILPTTLTSLATCSSAACIPINIQSTKKMGIASDIVETTIPMGTSFHKDGSVVGSVFKVMFLVYLFSSKASIGTILIVSLLATLLVSAIPIGGGTISEMFILTFMGFPVSSLPILTIIATIIDAPATVLNVVGDSASSMIVGRMVDGKNFLKK